MQSVVLQGTAMLITYSSVAYEAGPTTLPEESPQTWRRAHRRGYGAIEVRLDAATARVTW